MPNTTARRGRTRARVAAATALAVLGTTAVGALTSAASAAVGAPGSLAVSLANSSTPVLSWTRPKGVTEFSIQVDNDPSFGSTEVNENTRNTRYVPSRNLSRGTQYWRVRSAKDGQYSVVGHGLLQRFPRHRCRSAPTRLTGRCSRSPTARRSCAGRPAAAPPPTPSRSTVTPTSSAPRAGRPGPPRSPSPTRCRPVTTSGASPPRSRVATTARPRPR